MKGGFTAVLLQKVQKTTLVGFTYVRKLVVFKAQLILGKHNQIYFVKTAEDT